MVQNIANAAAKSYAGRVPSKAVAESMLHMAYVKNTTI